MIRRTDWLFVGLCGLCGWLAGRLFIYLIDRITNL